MANNNDQVNMLADKFKGEVVVSHSDDVWDEIDEEYRNALVLKLANGESFSAWALGNIMKKAWNLQVGVEFQEVGNNMVVAKFNEETQLNRIVDSGPWHFDGTSILMKRMECDKKLEDLHFDELKVWIQIHNLHYYEAGLWRRFIGGGSPTAAVDGGSWWHNVVRGGGFYFEANSGGYGILWLRFYALE